MGSAHSDTAAAFTAHKILIAGGFGSGKTTLGGAISEVRPLRTEETLTTASCVLPHESGQERASWLKFSDTSATAVPGTSVVSSA